MNQDTATLHTRIESRSVFTNVLSLSGYAGLAVGLILEAYRLYLVDSAIGMGSAPEWVTLGGSSLLVGSIVALQYTRVLDDVFEGWLDLVVLCLVIGQWGVLVSSYLDATIGGAGSPYGFLIIACAGLYALVAVPIAINYARRCWPSTSAVTGSRTE
ncbi:hypothetical protein [Halococcus salifodinae]|uniref:Uncharacterized protein n=1 Tax=Halococcus salifodinae DSM 8989 TaxID=1227456 RepID=M0N0J5_9EURY|nr:hypothetical protein [Halococcus salifodinae]EMA51058.1 hypothetical protein C450_13025 [Halococcus salifodinae DSM 8989]